MESNVSRDRAEAIENVCKIEQIEPYYKRDVTLVRKTNHFGTETYHQLNQRGNEVFVHRGCLESEMLSIIEAVKVIEDAAQQRQDFEIWSALTAIRRKAEERIDEIFRIIDQEIGDIEIYCVGENLVSNNLRYGQVVRAKLSPPDLHIERPITDVTMMTQS